MSGASSSTRLYATLTRVLDGIRAEASKRDPTYNPPVGNSDALIQARSRALLHLFLKARFGLTDFGEREKFVTDGPYDGGVDAFYIDHQNKSVLIVQSKFRANAANFESVNMSANDLLKMDVSRILKGETKSEDGRRYNGRILSNLQSSIRTMANGGKYKYIVVLLGNMKICRLRSWRGW